MTSDPNKPLINIFNKKIIKPPPVWLMRQAGRYLPEYREIRKKSSDFLDLCRSPELAAMVALQPWYRYHFDGVILFSDILVVPDALGYQVCFVENEGPRIRPPTGETIPDMSSPEGLNQRLEPAFATLRRIHRDLDSMTSLIGFAGAPWTLAAYMVEGRGSKDFFKARSMMYAERNRFSELIDGLTKTVASFLIGQIDSGAEVVQLFDSWAGLLSEEEFGRWVIGPTKTIVNTIKERYPDIPIIGYPGKVGLMLEEYALSTELDGVSLDQTIPLKRAVRDLGDKVVLQGNLDPLLLVVGGDAMRYKIDEILEVTRDIPFIFNLGQGVLPQTPPDHVRELVDRVRGF